MDRYEIIHGFADDIYNRVKHLKPNLNYENYYMFLFDNDALIEFASLKKEEWDSKHFDKNIWNLEIQYRESLNKGQMQFFSKFLNEICASLNVDCLYSKINTKEVTVIHLLEESGFKIMDTIVTLNYKYPIGNRFKVMNKFTFSVIEEKKDLKFIMDMCEELYTTDRFHLDVNLPIKKSNEIYSSWVLNQSKDRNSSIFKLEKENDIVGFVTCKLIEEKKIVIGLVGVHPNYQGRGIGKALLQNLIKKYENIVDEIQVGTQLNNLSALRCYLSQEFKMTATTHSFHKWL